MDDTHTHVLCSSWVYLLFLRFLLWIFCLILLFFPLRLPPPLHCLSFTSSSLATLCLSSSVSLLLLCGILYQKPVLQPDRDLTRLFCRSAIRISSCWETTSEGTFGIRRLDALIPNQQFIYNATLVSMPRRLSVKIRKQWRGAKRVLKWQGPDPEDKWRNFQSAEMGSHSQLEVRKWVTKIRGLQCWCDKATWGQPESKFEGRHGQEMGGRDEKRQQEGEMRGNNRERGERAWMKGQKKEQKQKDHKRKILLIRRNTGKIKSQASHTWIKRALLLLLQWFLCLSNLWL